MRMLLAVGLLLVLASPAQATLHMYGADSVQWAWAQEAQQHVPLPDARLRVVDGRAMYFRAILTLSVPFDTPTNEKAGWTALAEHGLYLHELGHAYDYADMTPARRAAFEKIIGTACAWWARLCPTDRYGTTINVPVGERFADMYAACAMGLTQREYQDAGFNTYGWLPPDGTDAQLCDLIR